MDIKKIVVGTLFYECQSGMNLEAVALDAPQVTDSFDGKDQYSWTGRNTQTGEDVSYMITEGMGAYGPRLYADPQYASFMEGSVSYPLYGGEPIDFQDPSDKLARDSEVLKKWIEEPAGTPLKEFYERLTAQADLSPEM